MGEIWELFCPHNALQSFFFLAYICGVYAWVKWENFWEILRSYGGVGSSGKEEKENNDRDIKREGKNRSSEGKFLLLYFLCASSHLYLCYCKFVFLKFLNFKFNCSSSQVHKPWFSKLRVLFLFYKLFTFSSKLFHDLYLYLLNLK